MNPTLEIILPVRNPDEQLLRTVASITSQTDRNFTVLLGDNSSASGLEHLEAAAKQLGAAGIPLRVVKPPYELKNPEHCNWVHSQATSDWLKPLAPGDILKPTCVERLKLRLSEKPQAHFVRCDLEMTTEWGVQPLRAPFTETAITPPDFMEYFPANLEWTIPAANTAYTRLAWASTGGHCVQLPGLASLNLNVTLALKYGLENIPEPLVLAGAGKDLSLNGKHRARVNFPLELWLILRQARNYCLANKLPWPGKRPWLHGLSAAIGFWQPRHPPYV